MSGAIASKVSREAFEARYAAVPDPWDFETSPYELTRYQCILRALSRSRYGTIYEPGCSIGVLTALLAGIAARVIASDIAPSAVRYAKARCASLANVEILCENAALYVPNLPLDLIVFSEIGYYFGRSELIHAASRLANCLSAGGEFAAVHWLGHSEDHILHGDEVHEALTKSLPLTWAGGERFERFRIDSWKKA